MTEKHSVLVVDDEELNYALIERALKGGFETHYVPSGKECLEYLKSNPVETVLLDINMPEMDGYEVCRAIKNDNELLNIPVIFVSALDSLEERVKGYDAGGDDYVVKPFQAEELRKKVDISVQSRHRFNQLKQFSDSATEAAMQAMTTTGELGVVLNYFTDSFRIQNFEDITKSLCDTLANYGLKSTIQIRPPHSEAIDFDCSGTIKPLESSLLTKLKEASRIYDFDMRTVFNFPYISVLIKNMPVDDEAKYGRYKDHLALLVEGANARIESVSASLELQHQKKSMEKILVSTQKMLKDISDSDDKYKLEVTKVFENLIVRVEENLLTADLTEHQEEKLLGLVTETSDKMNHIYDSNKQTEEGLQSLIEELKPFLGDSKNNV